MDMATQRREDDQAITRGRVTCVVARSVVDGNHRVFVVSFGATHEGRLRHLILFILTGGGESEVVEAEAALLHHEAQQGRWDWADEARVQVKIL